MKKIVPHLNPNPPPISIPLPANTWYIFNQNFVSSTTWKMRVKAAGGAFNSFTGSLTYNNSIVSPAAVMFETNAASAAVYGDSIGTSDPDVPVATAHNLTLLGAGA